MARKPESGTPEAAGLVSVVPAPGLRFPADEVFAQSVTAAEAADLVATGVYVYPEPEAPATTEESPDAV